MSDLETAALDAHSLRILITYLARETPAERISIIGYSAGTRLGIKAPDPLSLMCSEAGTAGNGHTYFRKNPWSSATYLSACSSI